MYRRLGLILGVVVSALVLLPAAILAQGGDDAGPSVPGAALTSALAALPVVEGTRYVTLTGVDFRPRSSAAGYDDDGQGATFQNAGTLESFVARVQLPHNALITEVTYLFVDSDPANLTFRLTRYDPSASLTNLITGSSVTAPNGPGIQSLSFPAPADMQVDNTTNSYQLRVNPGIATSAHKIEGARIGFTVAASPTTVAMVAPNTTDDDNQPIEPGSSVAAINALPTTPGTIYQTYTGTDFRPRDSATGFNDDGFGRTNATTTPSDFFTVRLDLPQGASVTEVDYLFVDNAATDASFRITSYDPSVAVSSFTDLAVQTTSGMDPAVRTLSFAGDLVTIDNAARSYQIRALLTQPNATHKIAGARVGYVPGMVSGAVLAGTSGADDGSATIQSGGSQVNALPATPGFLYKTYTGTDFRPRNSATLFENDSFGAMFVSGGTLDYLQAHIDLPDGALIREITFLVVDNSATNLTLRFTAYDPTAAAGTGSAFMHLANTTTASLPINPDIQEITVAGPLGRVDNTRYSYVLRALPGVASNLHKVEGMRVAYTMPQSLVPAVFREHTGPW